MTTEAGKAAVDAAVSKLEETLEHIDLDGDGDVDETDVKLAHMLIKRLKSDLKSVKSIQANKAHKLLSKSEGDDAAMKKFMELVIATVNAWVTSQFFYELLRQAVSKATSTIGHDNLIARSIYAVVVSILVPLLDVLLARGGLPIQGAGLWQDGKRLFQACQGILLAWGWKDWINQVIFAADEQDSDNNVGTEFGIALLVAAVFTLILALAEALPCYGRSKKAVDTGGAGATFLQRFAILPSRVGLAAGFAWDQVAQFGIVQLQRRVQSTNVDFLIQLSYYLLLTPVIVYLTVKWDTKQNELKSEEAKAEVEAADRSNSGLSRMIKSAEHYGEEFERMAGTIVVSSLSFVYAWALSNTLNNLFFRVVMACEGAVTCTQGSNMVFSLGLSFLGVSIVMFKQTVHRRQKLTQTNQVLQMNAWALSVGWSWANSTKVALNRAKSSMKEGGGGQFFFVAMVIIWIVAFAVYRTFMQERRAWKRNRREEAIENGLAWAEQDDL